MKFRVLGNFTNGLGWFKTGDIYVDEDNVDCLIHSKLIEPIVEPKVAEEEKPKKPRRKKPDGLRDSE